MNTINGNSYASSRSTMKTAVWGPMTGALFGLAPTLASHGQHLAVPAAFDALIGHLSSRTTRLQLEYVLHAFDRTGRQRWRHFGLASCGWSPPRWS